MNTILPLPNSEMTIIDSAILTLGELFEKIGELKRGDRMQIQCKDQDEWNHLPSMIRNEFPYSNFRCVREMDDYTPIIKLTVKL